MSNDASLSDAHGGEPLHLKVEDAADMRVLSALLQDAAALAGDFRWLPGQRRFAFAANRFRWEERNGEGPHERVRVAVRIENVVAVRARGLDPARGDTPLNLLMLAWSGGERVDTLDLVFSGGAAFALEVEALEIYADDVARPWATRRRPDHDKA